MDISKQAHDALARLLVLRTGARLDGLLSLMPDGASEIIQEIRSSVEVLGNLALQNDESSAQLLRSRAFIESLLFDSQIEQPQQPLEESEVDLVADANDNVLFEKAMEHASKDQEYIPDNYFFQERIDDAKIGLAYAYADRIPDISPEDFRAYRVTVFVDGKLEDLEAAFVVLATPKGIPVADEKAIEKLRFIELFDTTVDTGKYSSHDTMNQLYANRPYGYLDIQETTLLPAENKSSKYYGIAYNDPNDILHPHHGQLTEVFPVQLSGRHTTVFRPAVIVRSNPTSITDSLSLNGIDSI